MRSHGCRDLLVYCEAIDCNHSTIMNAEHLPDNLSIRSLGPRMVCARCGHRGADVRPMTNKRHAFPALPMLDLPAWQAFQGGMPAAGLQVLKRAPLMGYVFSSLSRSAFSSVGRLAYENPPSTD